MRGIWFSWIHCSGAVACILTFVYLSTFFLLLGIGLDGGWGFLVNCTFLFYIHFSTPGVCI